MVNFVLMKHDVLIIRIGFVVLLAAVGYLLNPLSQTTHFDATRPTRQLFSAIRRCGYRVTYRIVSKCVRRKASLKTLIGAAVGSILGIVGAYLIGMLISSSGHQHRSGRDESFSDHRARLSLWAISA